MTLAWTTDAATADAARAVKLTLFWGLDGVVLRSLGGARVPNIAEASLRRRLDDDEVPVIALDPGLFEAPASARAAWLNDLDRLAEVAAFGDRLGCSLVRVGALGGPGSAQALAQAGDRAAALGLTLAVRNEAGTVAPTGAALAALLAEVSHDAVGADWRPADALAEGEAPADGLTALQASGASIACVGAHDGVPGDAWQERRIGEGEVGWSAHLAALAAAGFDGPVVIDALPKPVRASGLASATALIRAARAATR
ncbi:sugar phosphate isomerase/epimerase family protein [Rubrivirga sp. IMCC43871]|uniref:sugar phosphate isomerase/epimerase family protein n=1 Tax=Rubrivirga sp. IMCC43871 TaxID=3391575 RepID=UPI00398FEF91